MSDIAAKLTTIAENQQKVYDAGYAAGQAAGGDTDAAYQQGIADGKQAEYDRFWDAYQDNGNRTDYSHAFSGSGWNDETYNPKYRIIVTNASAKAGIFTKSLITDTKVPIDIEESLATFLFSNDNVVETIPSVTINPYLSYFHTNAFANLSKLKEIRFEGKIYWSISFGGCVSLSKESIINIVTSLDTEYCFGKMTLTLTKVAVGKAFETAPGLSDGESSAEWTALIEPKLNAGWTITLLGGD